MEASPKVPEQLPKTLGEVIELHRDGKHVLCHPESGNPLPSLDEADVVSIRVRPGACYDWFQLCQLAFEVPDDARVYIHDGKEIEFSPRGFEAFLLDSRTPDIIAEYEHAECDAEALANHAKAWQEEHGADFPRWVGNGRSW